MVAHSLKRNLLSYLYVEIQLESSNDGKNTEKTFIYCDSIS